MRLPSTLSIPLFDVGLFGLVRQTPRVLEGGAVILPTLIPLSCKARWRSQAGAGAFSKIDGFNKGDR